ncbi:hypothetical protein [Mangrovibacterium lignilyticum]|uniref:hypothetical protein n=1 Tax=Mangrovibacterium lignilyticum TaxID=2668052 RepID=UPI0013D01D88|nr:hypothetical protein [Mangrovibacterium lignilyticum]
MKRKRGRSGSSVVTIQAKAWGLPPSALLAVQGQAVGIHQLAADERSVRELKSVNALINDSSTGSFFVLIRVIRK